MNETVTQEKATTSDRGADHSDAKVVTVVLTPGRSGSSLLMEVLGNLGLGLSEDLIAGRLENPHGFFEDANVVEVHKRLLGELGARAGMPLPERWLDQQVTREAKRELTDLVRRQAGACEGGWVVKDPRISELLPLWLQVLNSAGVTPRFILALRDPAAVATSLRRSINRDERLTELQWLYRTTQALYHSAADCLVVHYEDWFDRPGELATGLAQYCGLSEITEEQGRHVAEKAIEQRLDRSSWQDSGVHHPLVRDLYAVLRGCKGTDFNRRLLLAKVRDVAEMIEGFQVWIPHGPRKETERALGEAERSNEALRTKVLELEGQVEARKETERALGEAERSNEALRTKVSELQSQVRNATEKWERAHSDHERLVREIHRLTRFLRDSEKSNEDLRARVVSLNQQAEGAAKTAKDLRESNKRVEDLNEQVSQLQAECKKTERALEQEKESNQKLRASEKRVEDLNAQVSKLQEEMAGCRKTERALEQQKHSNQTLRATVSDLKKRVRQAEKKAVRLTSDIDRMRRRPDPRMSVKYRLGDVLVKGFLRPGRNTFAMPVRLVRLGREGARNIRARRARARAPT